MVSEPVLETHGLTKDFGALRAVNTVDLKIQKGEIHSIIGPNGAGKTTFFNLLTGFLPPTRGRILFNGHDITGFPPYRICGLGIGRSFQIFNIFPDLSVLENVRLAVQSGTKINYRFWGSLRRMKSLEEKALNVLEQIGLREKATLLARTLANGEKRVLDIGVGLATGPRLLLLDEPMSSLAGHEIETIIGLIRAIANRITVVLIEHNIDVVLDISHRITVFNQGSVIAEGSPEEIQHNAMVQEVYLGGY
jgi:branched-chain amino acid transport system ATP-binding protein